MGDCLFAAIIARQIKEKDFPDCHLTWAVNFKCRQVVEANPYVDEIWEIPTEKSAATEAEWKNFKREAEQRKQSGDFDEIFPTQIIGENIFNFDGGIRSSTYNNYPRPISVSPQPTIRLSETEVENVRRFAAEHKLADFEQVILIECGPDSFSVALDAAAAINLAKEIGANRKIAFVLSSDKKINAASPNIVDGSVLSFRENAELTKFCDLLVGCASGISWLSTTDWAKKLPLVLMINRRNPVFPSMIFDHENINLPVEHIIEIDSDGGDALRKLRECVELILDADFARARREFNENLQPDNLDILELQLRDAYQRKDLKTFSRRVSRYARRSGWRTIFTAKFGKIIINLFGRSFDKPLKILKLKKNISSKALKND